MTQISSLIAQDPRSSWKKLTRRQLWRGAKRLEIPFKAGARHDEMVNLFVDKGISPEEVATFRPVVAKVPENGGVIEKVVGYSPDEQERKYDERKEMRREEEFERRIQAAVDKDAAEKQAEIKAKDQEIASLKSDMEEMKAMMNQMLEVSRETPKPVELPKVPEKSLADIHWKSFQKKAKEAGIEWNTKDPREPVIAQIEAQDGENAA